MADKHQVFSDILLHMNWHCKSDMQLITPEIQTFLYGFIRDYCRREAGVFFHEVGGIADHIHLVVEIVPTITISEWIGKIKGASAHAVNQRFGSTSLQWQRRYGVVSFARKNLPAIRNYVQHQEEHHRLGTINDILERHYFTPDPSGEDG